jgi:3-oxoacyl-(acyl-carrier-protein) synthase
VPICNAAPSPRLRGQQSLDFAKHVAQYSSSAGTEGSEPPSRTASPQIGLEPGRDRRPAGHSRSLSNSAAAELLARKGRAEDEMESPGLGVFIGGAASNFTDENFHQTIIPQTRNMEGRGDGKPPKDVVVVTGNCMTCGTVYTSTKGQDSVKCSVCACFTPMRSVGDGMFRQHRHGSAGAAASSPIQPSGRGSPGGKHNFWLYHVKRRRTDIAIQRCRHLQWNTPRGSSDTVC